MLVAGVKASRDAAELTSLHGANRDILNLLEAEYPGAGERIVELLNKRLKTVEWQAPEWKGELPPVEIAGHVGGPWQG
jgi:hypothetical protein